MNNLLVNVTIAQAPPALSAEQNQLFLAGIEPLTQPSDDEVLSWNKTKTLFTKLYGDLYTSIAAQSGPPTPSIDYRSTDYDILLTETITILERCLQIRSEFQDKLGRGFTLLLEYDDFIQNDAIHSKEIAGDGKVGIYTVQADVSRAEVESLECRLTSAAKIKEVYTDIVQRRFSPEPAKARFEAEQSLVYANLL